MERNSMLCPYCRKLISRDEKQCPYCNMPILAARWLEARSVMNISNKIDPLKAVIGVTLFYFLASLFFSALENGGSLGFMLMPSQNSLWHLGASGSAPINLHRYWTLINASFLHGGALHIAFNMLALWQIGGFILNCYGISRFLLIYILSGVLGFYVSHLVNIPFTIGASASVCGLIGAIIYYGKTRGGFYGGMIYKQALGWVIGIAIFGFIVPGINNWAHGGGLFAGIILGKLLGYNETSSESWWHRYTAISLVLLTLMALCWGLIEAFLYLVLKSHF